jgi:hypothetical protein
MMKLGKVLVFVNLVMSGLMAGWAFALFANYADWSESPPKVGQAGGLVGQRKERIKELQAALVPPQINWARTRRVLHLQEDQRQGDLAWYRGEMDFLRTGATDADPCRFVVLNAHQPVPDPKNFNRPQMDKANDRSGQPLQAMDKYEKISKETLEKLNGVLHEFAVKSVEDIELTTKLETLPDKDLARVTELIDWLKERADLADKNGDKREQEQLVGLRDRVQKLLGEVGKKGLQQRVIDERFKREGIVAEQGVIEPLWKVNEVDTELLLRRRETIDERVTELKNYLKKHYKITVAGRP